MAVATRRASLRENILTILHSLGEPLPKAAGQPALLIAVGLPGSGKSTFCRRVAAMCGAVVLESDRLRRLLFGRPTYSHDESGALFRALRIAAGICLRGGSSVIVDATNLTERERLPLYGIGEEAGARVVIAAFEAPADVVEERLARRAVENDASDYSEAGIEVYRMMAPLAEPVRRPHWLIDTSDAAQVEAAFTSILREVRDGTRPSQGGEDGGA